MEKMSNGRYPSRSRRLSLYTSVRRDLKALVDQYKALGCSMESGAIERINEVRYLLGQLAIDELTNEIGECLLKASTKEDADAPLQQERSVT